MNEVWAHIKTFLLNKGLDIAGAAVVLVVGLWAIKLLTRLVSKSKGFRKADPGAAGFLLSFATVALKLVLFLTVISMLGIPVVNFVTILATAGAAVGLAMQGSLSNLVGGVMLLFFKPFKVGDYIDTHTDAGTVDKISIFYTTLLTPDNRKIVIPNGALSNATIVNYSETGVRRLDLEFTVAYASDTEQVKALLLRCAAANPRTLPDVLSQVRQFASGRRGLLRRVRNAACFGYAGAEAEGAGEEILDRHRRGRPRGGAGRGSLRDAHRRQFGQGCAGEVSGRRDRL